jgi:hypothetical protein
LDTSEDASALTFELGMLFSFQRPTLQKDSPAPTVIVAFDTPPAKAAEFTQIRFAVKREFR